MSFKRTQGIFSFFLCLLLAASQFKVSAQSSTPSVNNTSLALQLKTRFPRLKGEVLSVILSPDDRVLVPVTWNKTTELWDTKTGRLIAAVDGRPLRPISYSDFLLIDAFSPDSKTLMTIAGGDARLWDTANGKLKRALKGHTKDIRSAAFSPDGDTIATGSADGTVKLWNAATGEVKSTLDAFKMKRYARWRIISRKIANIFAEVSVSFSRDSKTLLTVALDQETKLWDARSGALLAVLGKNLSGHFSPAGRFIFTQRADFSGTDLWDAETGKLKATLEGGQAAFSPNEQWLGLVGYQGSKGLLNLKTMKLERPLPLSLNDFETWAAFSPDGKTFALASGIKKHSVNLVDIASGTLVANLPIEAKQGFDLVSEYLKYWEKLSFDPQSRFLMGAKQTEVRFWDARTGRPLTAITDGRDPAASSGDGKFVVTTDKDKKSLSLWEVKWKD